jgi:plastocyanin
MRTACLMQIAALILLWTVAGASDNVVRQKGRAFSVATLTVARGEPVVFLNDDTVPHNIMSASPDNAFDLGSQMPGSATPVSFDIAGVVVVICAIHPRMRMTIVVTN